MAAPGGRWQQIASGRDALISHPLSWLGSSIRARPRPAMDGQPYLPPENDSRHPPPETLSPTFALLHAAPPHLHLCTSCPHPYPITRTWLPIAETRDLKMSCPPPATRGCHPPPETLSPTFARSLCLPRALVSSTLVNYPTIQLINHRVFRFAACQPASSSPRGLWPRLPLPILNTPYSILSYCPLNSPLLFPFRDHNPHSIWR